MVSRSTHVDQLSTATHGKLIDINEIRFFT